jgi:hypothetical protein
VADRISRADCVGSYLIVHYFIFLFRRPTNDSAMEAFIRNKYEKKKFIAKVCISGHKILNNGRLLYKKSLPDKNNLTSKFHLSLCLLVPKQTFLVLNVCAGPMRTYTTLKSEKLYSGPTVLNMFFM